MFTDGSHIDKDKSRTAEDLCGWGLTVHLADPGAVDLVTNTGSKLRKEDNGCAWENIQYTMLRTIQPHNPNLGDAEARSGGVDRQIGMYYTPYHPSL
eukprot:SAG25_NODE_85_length_16527_cov_73.409240_6_plen_97_part_00